jgi:hypothetical protein
MSSSNEPKDVGRRDFIKKGGALAAFLGTLGLSKLLPGMPEPDVDQLPSPVQDQEPFQPSGIPGVDYEDGGFTDVGLKVKADIEHAIYRGSDGCCTGTTGGSFEGLINTVNSRQCFTEATPEELDE